MKVLCSISTRGRYHTFLPLALQSAITQSRAPDKIVIFDDNNEPDDMRKFPVYQQLFKMMNLKGIEWEWVYAKKMGQHYNHQMANKMGFDLVWRVDDDNVAEPTVLETLLSYFDDTVGAVGGEVLTPDWDISQRNSTGKIEDIDFEPNIQWGKIPTLKEVDHLHCTFLYRAGVVDYNLNLSRVAHREETIFTYRLRQAGYRVLVVPTTTWHLKAALGGIRAETNEGLYLYDEKIFKEIVQFKDRPIVVLDCGMGDHIVFRRSVLPLLENPVIFSCYNDIIPGRSIQDAIEILGNIDEFNIYKKMGDWKWSDSIGAAFRKMYHVQ